MLKLCILVVLLSVCLISGQQYPLHLLNPTEYPDTACLDGTPPGFYYRINNSSKNWVIRHKGGGWCYDVPSCYDRSKTALGTSRLFPKTIPFDGVMSADPKVNPVFHDWNAIYIYYCDGSSFSSHNNPVVHNGSTLHFRGQNNLQGVFRELRVKYGLNAAERVIITGSSAGGLATYLHIDWWAAHLPNVHVVGLPDAGWFIDAPNTAGVYKHTHDMKTGWALFNSSGFVNDACIAHYTDKAEQWKCYYAQYTYPFIKTPLFVWNSRFDSWQADNILQLSCDPRSHSTHKCNATELQWLDNYGMEFMKTVTPVLANPRDGHFLDACYYHTGVDWAGVLIDKLSLGEAFAKWYQGANIRLVDNCPVFPCNPTCPSAISLADYF